MQIFRLLIAVGVLLPPCKAQPFVERVFGRPCADTEVIARAYLKSRGFTEYRSATGLLSRKILLDAQGKPVGTRRIRRDLSRDKVSFFVWSSPLHAIVALSAKPLPSGCRLGLSIDFGSFHMAMIGILPGGDPLELRSNGRLESDYLDAIQAQIEGDRH
jgi:hypothetical protein